jgi:hypothetical protein
MLPEILPPNSNRIPDGTKPVTLSPTPDGLLGLPIVQDFHFVSFSRVVGKSKRIGFIGAAAEVAPTDPRSCCCASVIAKTKALGDFHEVRRSAHRQASSSSPGLQVGVAG